MKKRRRRTKRPVVKPEQPVVEPAPPTDATPADGSKRPQDLSELPLEVKPWPLKDRIAAAKTCVGSYDCKLVAVTITMVKNPETIRNGNCFDIMCKGQYAPWGTHRADWGQMSPAGYAMLDAEPILAFNDPKMSLQLLITMVERRRIYRPDEYAFLWRNLQPGSQAWDEVLLRFEEELDSVIRHWD